MGKHVNTRFNTFIGTVFLVLIVLAAAVSFPLMIFTHFGQP